MAHLNDGALRRLHDEPLAIGERDRQHYDSCDACRARFDTVGGDASAAAELLSLPDLKIEPAGELVSLRRRIQAGEAAHPVGRFERLGGALSWRWPRLARPTAVLAAAALLVGVVGVTGAAQNLIKVFEPKSFVAVQVSPSDFTGTPVNPADYGTLKWSPGPPDPHEIGNATAAAAASGLPLLTPASLPSFVPNQVSYAVIDRATGSFTFSGPKAPAGIRGSTLYATAGPALLEYYASPNATTAEGQIPVLVIGETRTPTVYSTGASTKQLEDFLLSQPGISPQLALQLRAIKDPSATLPIPVPAGVATSRQVQVQGVHGGQGLLLDAGLVAGVVWQKGGIIYAVGGQLTPDQVLSIASSLY